MTYLGMTLAAAPRVFGWGEVSNWVRHLPPESATMRWAAAEMAERDDANGGINNRKFGKDAIPISDFDKWYYGGG